MMLNLITTFLSKIRYIFKLIVFNKKKIISYNLLQDIYTENEKSMKLQGDVLMYIKNRLHYYPLVIQNIQPDLEDIIYKACHANGIEPRMLMGILYVLLNNVPEDASIESINSALGLQLAPTIESKIFGYARMINRYIRSFNIGKQSLKVRVSDQKDLVVKNMETYILYQLMPYVGNKKWYTYERTSDKDGVVTKVEKVLTKTPPYGCFLYWLIDNRHHER